MSCADLKFYLSHRMTFQQAFRFLSHMSKCPKCRLERALDSLEHEGESEFGFAPPTEEMVKKAIRLDHPGFKLSEPAVDTRKTCAWCRKRFEPLSNASALCSEGCKLLQKRYRERKRSRRKVNQC